MDNQATLLIITHLMAYYLGIFTVCLLTANREKMKRRRKMDQKTRLDIERATGMIEAMIWVAPPGLQEALTVALEMIDNAVESACVKKD